MKMVLLCPLLAVALAGCSKKEVAADDSQPPASTNTEAAAEPAPEQPAPAADAAPAPEVQVVDVQISKDLNALPDTLKNQDYDAAVDTLTAAKLAAMSEDQRRAYMEQMYKTLQYLQQKAETDARAQEAYQKLGRRMMGR